MWFFFVRCTKNFPSFFFRSILFLFSWSWLYWPVVDRVQSFPLSFPLILLKVPWSSEGSSCITLKNVKRRQEFRLNRIRGHTVDLISRKRTSASSRYAPIISNATIKRSESLAYLPILKSLEVFTWICLVVVCHYLLHVHNSFQMVAMKPSFEFKGTVDLQSSFPAPEKNQDWPRNFRFCKTIT